MNNFFQKNIKGVMLVFIILCIFLLLVYTIKGGFINFVDQGFPFYFEIMFQRLLFVRNDYIYLGYNQSLSILSNLSYIIFFMLIQKVFHLSPLAINHITYIVSISCTVFFAYLFISELFESKKIVDHVFYVFLGLYFISSPLSFGLLSVGIIQQIFGFGGIFLAGYAILKYSSAKRYAFMLLILLIASVLISNFNIPYTIIAYISVNLIIVVFLNAKIIDRIKIIILFGLIFGLANAYWIVPFLYSSVVGISTINETISSVSNQILDVMYLTKIRYTLQYLLLNIINYQHVIDFNADNSLLNQYFADKIFYVLAGLLNGAVLYLGFFRRKVDKKAIYCLIIILIGLFLAKGINQPFGSIYELGIKNSNFLKIFRDSLKWLLIVNVFMTILVAYLREKRTSFYARLFLVLFIGIYIFPRFSGLFGRLEGYSIPFEYFEYYKNSNNAQSLFSNNRNLLLWSKVGPTSYKFDPSTPKISSNIIKYLSPNPIVDLFSPGGGNSFDQLQKLFNGLTYTNEDLKYMTQFGVSEIINDKNIVGSSKVNYSNKFFDKISYGSIDLYKLKENYVAPKITSLGGVIKFTKINPTKYGLQLTIDDLTQLDFLYSYDSERKLYPGHPINTGDCSSVEYYSGSQDQLDIDLTTSGFIITSGDSYILTYITTTGESLRSILSGYGYTVDQIYPYNRGLSLYPSLGEKLQITIPNKLVISGSTIDQLVSAKQGSGELTWGPTSECIRDGYMFFEGSELSYLWRQPLWDNSHKMIHDYANGWTIDLAEKAKNAEDAQKVETYLEQGLREGRITQNSDGSYNVALTLYFRPQSWFYLGLLISGTTFIGLIGWLIRDWRRTRYKSLEIAQ